MINLDKGICYKETDYGTKNDYLKFLLYERIEFLKTDKSQEIDYNEIDYCNEVLKTIK
jgi:hypothetical protein